MQASQLVISSQSGIGHFNDTSLPAGPAGAIKRWFSKLVGCGHRELSRPFGNEGQSYRVCLECGAQRRFNTGRWEMQGDFYYSLPTSKHFRALNGLSALRRVAS